MITIEKPKISSEPNPPTIEIPDNTIACIPHDPNIHDQKIIEQLYSPLKNQVKRDWFVKHAYSCLPLVMGNQHGFVLKSLYNFTVSWNGGDEKDDVVVTIDPEDLDFYQKNSHTLSISPHFGMGTFTMQTCFTLRTPQGVNLLTINPPNLFVDGLCPMTACIETDNLRRDFTFNTRVTTSNATIVVRKGDPLGCVVPYPRHFIDQYKMVIASDVLTKEQLEDEFRAGKDFGVERTHYDKDKKNNNGRRYFKGEDVYGNKFPDHQKSLDKDGVSKCPFLNQQK